jgi:hypothetical protein
MTNIPKLTAEALHQFTGTDQWYRHGLMRNVLYTDGVLYLAETGGAHWLVDEIATTQLVRTVAAEPFQHWTLRVTAADRSGVLTCDDGNGNTVYTKAIEWTDFPLDEVELYFTGGVIMLPSEY